MSEYNRPPLESPNPAQAGGGLSEQKIAGWRSRPQFAIDRVLSREEMLLEAEIEDLSLLGTPEAKKQIEKLKRPPALLAYGGTSYSMRRQFGDWHGVPRELLEDLYGLSGGKAGEESGEFSYGVGELENKRFIILRQRQNTSNRGGYAYSFLFDPGEIVWRMAKWNGAAIMQRILEDPELSNMVLNHPEQPSYFNIRPFAK